MKTNKAWTEAEITHIDSYTVNLVQTLNAFRISITMHFKENKIKIHACNPGGMCWEKEVVYANSPPAPGELIREIYQAITEKATQEAVHQYQLYSLAGCYVH